MDQFQAHVGFPGRAHLVPKWGSPGGAKLRPRLDPCVAHVGFPTGTLEFVRDKSKKDPGGQPRWAPDNSIWVPTFTPHGMWLAGKLGIFIFSPISETKCQQLKEKKNGVGGFSECATAPGTPNH